MEPKIYKNMVTRKKEKKFLMIIWSCYIHTDNPFFFFSILIISMNLYFFNLLPRPRLIVELPFLLFALSNIGFLLPNPLHASLIFPIHWSNIPIPALRSLSFLPIPLLLFLVFFAPLGSSLLY